MRTIKPTYEYHTTDRKGAPIRYLAAARSGKVIQVVSTQIIRHKIYNRRYDLQQQTKRDA